MTSWFKNEAGFDKVFVFTSNSPPIYETNPPILTTPTFGHVRRFLRAQFEDTERSLLRAGDNLWFFFAGHGKRYRDKDYLMLADSDPGDLEHTAISVDYVTQRLRRSGADNVVLVLDACRDESNRSRGELGIGNEKHQGVITFYSCNANQQSWEIEELGHGIFTHVLLQGLRSQGEGNCATVERLDQYLRCYVPQLNVRYGKPRQNPYLKAEPPYKMYFVLLEQSATLRDVESLKSEAYKAELEEHLIVAEQLWIRVLAVSRGDLDAIGAIQRIAVKKTTIRQEPIPGSVISTSENVTSLRGEGAEISRSEIQKQEKHDQNLGQYKQSFSQAVEEEFPLSEVRRNKLNNLQKSLGLRDEEISEIEQPIVARKEAQRLKQQEAERKRQKQTQAKTITSSILISRKQFLRWAGLGGGGLAIAVVIALSQDKGPNLDLKVNSKNITKEQMEPPKQYLDLKVNLEFTTREKLEFRKQLSLDSAITEDNFLPVILPKETVLQFVTKEPLKNSESVNSVSDEYWLKLRVCSIGENTGSDENTASSSKSPIVTPSPEEILSSDTLLGEAFPEETPLAEMSPVKTTAPSFTDDSSSIKPGQEVWIKSGKINFKSITVSKPSDIICLKLKKNAKSQDVIYKK